MYSRPTIRAASRLSQLARQNQPTTIRNMASYNGTTQTLNTGAKIPSLGFGTWQDRDAQSDAVYEALKAGYRHIDTARVYGTEPGVAEGISKSGVPREEIFLVTKLWNHQHDNVEQAINDSLKDLKTDYVDLYLMHWPSPFKGGKQMIPKDKDNKTIPGDTDFVDTWKQMEKVAKSGKAKAIGVSNFSKAELERLISNTDTVPAVHQLELHPYLNQKDFDEFHRAKGIHITQYSPFGNANEVYEKGKTVGKLIDDQVLVDIGKKHGKNGAQVALAWGIAKGHSVIPKSKTPARIKSNLDGDFKLDEEDVQKIDALDKKLRFNDPSESFGWNFYKDLDGKH